MFREGAHVIDGRIDRNPKWLPIAGDIGDHRAALVRGDQRYGQVPWVGVGAQIAPTPHCLCWQGATWA